MCDAKLNIPFSVFTLFFRLYIQSPNKKQIAIDIETRSKFLIIKYRK